MGVGMLERHNGQSALSMPLQSEVKRVLIADPQAIASLTVASVRPKTQRDLGIG